MERAQAATYTFFIFSKLNTYFKEYLCLLASGKFLRSYNKNGIIMTDCMKKRQAIRKYFSAGIDIIQGGIQAALIVAQNTKNQAK